MAATAPPVAVPQSLTTRPLPRRRGASRVPAPLWIAIAAAIVSALTLLVVTGAANGEPVAVAARDMAAGETVGRGDFRYVDPDVALRSVLGRSEAEAATGQVTTHAVSAGQPLGRSDLAPPAGPERQRAMSIPLDVAHAVGGTLRRGDTVDVIDSSSGEALYIVTGAQVLSTGVESPGSRGLGGSSSRYAVTIAVDAAGALRVAHALAGGKVDVVRSTGSPAVAVSPTTPTTVRR